MKKTTSDKRRARIFISYAKPDHAIAKRLYDFLENAGAEPWLDAENLTPGDNWEHEIKEALRCTDVFLVVLSKRFEDIGFRQKEVRWALDAWEMRPPGKGFIIPFATEPIDLPSWCSPIHVATALEQLIPAIEKHSGMRLDGILRTRQNDSQFKSDFLQEKRDAHKEIWNHVENVVLSIRRRAFSNVLDGSEMENIDYDELIRSTNEFLSLKSLFLESDLQSMIHNYLTSVRALVDAFNQFNDREGMRHFGFTVGTYFSRQHQVQPFADAMEANKRLLIERFRVEIWGEKTLQ